jgi:chaperonin GroEL
MSTKTLFGDDLKKKLLDGILKLNASVSSTLGPGGRNVLIQKEDGTIAATKDGVSVAKSFHKLDDDIENIGAQLVKQVSVKSANEAGDGTTTSTLLATTMIEEGIKLIDKGVNVVEVKKQMEQAVSEVIAELKSMAKPVTSNEQIKYVATISGNNDEEIGNLISEAISEVGYDGIVTIESSKTGETILDIVEGMQFDRGYKSPYFVTDNNSMKAALENPLILLYDGVVGTAADLVPVLQKASGENQPIVIIAEEFSEEALAVMLVNKARGTIKVCAIKAPDYGDRRTLLLEDMATLTGGTVISPKKGHKLEKIVGETLNKALGNARMVTVTKDTTTIVDGKGSAEELAIRAEELKTQIDAASSMFEREKLQERLGRLSGGVAIVSVGGNSDLEIKEKRDRVEDALYATKAAIAEGVIPGSGWPLYNIALGLTGETLGETIVKSAISSPFNRILTNAGLELAQETLDKLVESVELAFDVKQQKVVNAYKSGLLDPVKVTRIALENALSVASTILTSESVVFEERKDESPDPGMGMGF